MKAKFDRKAIPGGTLDFCDSIGWHESESEEAKAAGLVKDISNSRLAVLGIFAFLSQQTIPGAVPLLKGVVPPHDREVMSPFAKSLLLSIGPQANAIKLHHALFHCLCWLNI